MNTLTEQIMLKLSRQMYDVLEQITINKRKETGENWTMPQVIREILFEHFNLSKLKDVDQLRLVTKIAILNNTQNQNTATKESEKK